VTAVVTPGTGSDHPSPTDVVKVRFTAYDEYGRVVGECAADQFFTFPLRLAILGWVEGIALMVPGETRRMWIPPSLAQTGERGASGIRAATAAPVYDITLVAIVPSPKPPGAPDDVRAPPATARRTASGLAYRLLASGSGASAPRPRADSAVTIAYTGWAPDGGFLDTTVPLAPRTISLSGAIPGWVEGLQMMKVGDKMRLWVPARLAYDVPAGAAGTAAGAGAPPTGNVVFDMELLAVSTSRTRGAPRSN
jgi:FKBP-type peptidyl-prolyl cis-trans isomerase